MIEQVLQQQRAISQVLASDKKTRHLVLTWQDLEVLKSVHKALKPLVEFTDALSGEDYVTVSFVKPVLLHSLMKHQQSQNQSHQKRKPSEVSSKRQQHPLPQPHHRSRN